MPPKKKNNNHVVVKKHDDDAKKRSSHVEIEDEKNRGYDLPTTLRQICYYMTIFDSTMSMVEEKVESMSKQPSFAKREQSLSIKENNSYGKRLLLSNNEEIQEQNAKKKKEDDSCRLNMKTLYKTYTKHLDPDATKVFNELLTFDGAQCYYTTSIKPIFCTLEEANTILTNVTLSSQFVDVFTLDVLEVDNDRTRMFLPSTFQRMLSHEPSLGTSYIFSPPHYEDVRHYLDHRTLDLKQVSIPLRYQHHWFLLVIHYENKINYILDSNTADHGRLKNIVTTLLEKAQERFKVDQYMHGLFDEIYPIEIYPTADAYNDVQSGIYLLKYVDATKLYEWETLKLTESEIWTARINYFMKVFLSQENKSKLRAALVEVLDNDFN